MNITVKTFDKLLETYQVRNCFKLCGMIQQNFINSSDLEDLRDAAKVQDVILISDFSGISDVFTIRVTGTKDNDFIGIEADPAGGRVVIKCTYNVKTKLVHTLYSTSDNSPVISMLFGKDKVLVNSKSYTYEELESIIFQHSLVDTKIELDFINTRISQRGGS